MNTKWKNKTNKSDLKKKSVKGSKVNARGGRTTKNTNKISKKKKKQNNKNNNNK